MQKAKCPITDADIEIISHLVTEAVSVETAKSEPNLVCAVALDWQSEDKNTVRRLARFCCAAAKMNNKPNRDLVTRMVEVAAAGVVALRNRWLSVPLSQFLCAMPPKLSAHRDYVLLWSGCGILYLTIVSNAENTYTNEAILCDYVYARMKHHERFRDCREWDVESKEWNEWH